jgi:hypothetical protein
MRHDPLITSWVIRCQSEQELATLKAWVLPLLSPDWSYVETVIAYPGGIRRETVRPHKASDYFTELSTLPASEPPSSFRLLFHRKPDSGRYWKDLMIRFLQEIRARFPGVTIVRDDTGEKELLEDSHAGQ